MDARAHKTIYDGCQVARSRGAAVKRFRFEDPDHLDQLLRAERDPTRLVCMDGVNSMTGNAPDLPAFAAVAREHGALLYVDDAHGFGVIGERSERGLPVRPARQQRRPPLRRDLRQRRARRRLLEGVLVAAGVHRLPDRRQGPAQGRRSAVPLLRARRRSRRSRRCWPAWTSTSSRGDELRGVLCRHTRRVLDCLERLGVDTPNRSGFPIIEIPLRDYRRIAEVGQLLFDRGVYVTLAAFPLVPKAEVGFRIQLTAANTDAEVDTLIEALEELAGAGRAQARRRRGAGPALAGRRMTSVAAAARAEPVAGTPRGRRRCCARSTCFVPPFAGSPIVMNVLGLSPVVAIVVGLRRYQPASPAPWWCFALGLFLFWLGDVYTYSYELLLESEVPFPSLGDAAYILVYPVLMAGLFLLVRRRNPEGDRAGVIDSLIMTLGLGARLVGGADRALPRDDELTIVPKLVSIAYPLGDILLLAAAIRLAVDAGKRAPAFYLLASSIVTLLLTDFVYGLVTLNGTYTGQLWLDAGWIVFYLLWGAAALHPSMRELEQAAPERDMRLRPLRLGTAAGRGGDRAGDRDGAGARERPTA